MQLRELPAGERPRERLIACGAAALSDAELLAILLRTGRRGENVIDLARRILAQFHTTGLAELLRMPPQELARTEGLGPAKAATVLAALELGRRVQCGEPQLPRTDDAEEIAALLMPRYRFERREHFIVLPMTSKNEILMTADISTGTLTNVLVHPREVFEPAIRCGAAHVVLVHNHPSGDPAPSAEDRRITRVMTEAGRLLGIPVVDHIVLGGGRYFSFAEHGAL